MAISRWRASQVEPDGEDEAVAAIAASIRVRLTMRGFKRVSPGGSGVKTQRPR
ncbi:MAG: hypothetical protein ACLP3C_21710 [Mycobacterium sp.]|uniref:hypothetical protein n=1 Tax=Mycobacterium sp. TaxID=1785 RepID=UPI003C58A0EA